MAATDRDIVVSLLHESSPLSHEFGGLEFYGYSAEFRDLMSLCREFSTGTEGAIRQPKKAYVFLESYHGKSSLAKAISIEAGVNKLKVHRLDGTVGLTLKELGGLQQMADVLVVVDGVPEASSARSALLERLNSLKGRAVLFARPDYATDANLKTDIPAIKLSHVDRRPLDKVAWLIGLVREHLRDENGAIAPRFIAALQQVPASALVTLCSVPVGSKVANFGDLAKRLAEGIQLGANLRAEAPMTEEELATIFVEFHSSGAAQSDPGFRLWVEGESDLRLLKLVCRLALQLHGVDLEEGLTIVPLGEGREGGTSKVTEVVVSRRTKRNKDIFLFDADGPGRHAQEELEILDQEVVFLDSKVACSRVEADVEIEDFISLACLDRFYQAYPDLRPEKEIIKYKPPTSRRLVVNGADKELLVQWLDANAVLEDLENLMFILCEVRSRFSLRNLSVMRDKQGWRKRLIEESSQHKHFGNRSEHWI